MGFDGLSIFVVEHLQRIAKKEGFEEGYDVKHGLGSKAGDGLMSTMLSIKLSGYRRMQSSGIAEMSELALILKLQPSSVARQEHYGSERLFKREVYMYNKLLPALTAFQKEHQVSKEMIFSSFPKCFEAFHENGSSESLIVMEDLRPAGFDMWKRSKRIEFENVRLVLEQLGRLHGLSIAIRYQKPELFQEIRELPQDFIDILTAPGHRSMIESSYDHVISLMDNADDIESLKYLVKNLKPIMAAGLDEGLHGKYGVINHGDCWLNNMMFASDEQGLAKSVTLIDWQCSQLSSPAVDLSFFLLSGTDKPLRDAHLDEFLQIYYSNLASTIRATGGDPDVLFPEAELQHQLRQFGIYGVLMAPLFIPIILAEYCEMTSVEDMAETMSKGTGDFEMLYKFNETKEKHFVQRLKDVLADARLYGWL